MNALTFIGEDTEASADRILRLLRRRRRRDDNLDRGNWLGLGDIKQMAGGDRESNRGELIALVARGDVEVSLCANGTFWRAYVEEAPKRVNPDDVADRHYTLQRELMGDTRLVWFDAETFTNANRAKRALRHAEQEVQARVREWGRGYAQSVRLISQVPA